jgi:hypothetical protein
VSGASLGQHKLLVRLECGGPHKINVTANVEFDKTAGPMD